jgi:hypothetical protein
MSTREISSESLEYVKVWVDAKRSGVSFDPTSDVVEMAFTTGSDIDEADWQNSSWETIGRKYYARCLVGPGGAIELDDGLYQVWVRITDSPEIPVLTAGYIKVI